MVVSETSYDAYNYSGIDYKIYSINSLYYIRTTIQSPKTINKLKKNNVKKLSQHTKISGNVEELTNSKYNCIFFLENSLRQR